MSRSALSLATSRLSRAISNCSAFTLARKCLLRIVSKRLNPAAQLGLMYAQVFRRLRVRHAAFLDQAYRLELELSRKLPSLHDPPPAPSKHLTRCLRNRAQANPTLNFPLVET